MGHCLQVLLELGELGRVAWVIGIKGVAIGFSCITVRDECL